MKILVAIDGSDNSLRALQYAIRLAGDLSTPTELLLANVHDDVALRSATQFVSKESVDAYLDDVAASELKQAVEIAGRSGVKFGTRLLRGQVGSTIADAAASERCDLLVLGSKGRTALKELLMGSVAQRVVSLSPVPVLLVK